MKNCDVVTNAFDSPYRSFKGSGLRYDANTKIFYLKNVFYGIKAATYLSFYLVGVEENMSK